MKVKNYVYAGLGFPVVLAEVELRRHGDDRYPIIDNRKLQDEVFRYFLDHDVALTGSQLAFIRKYMDLTQSELAKEIGLQGHGRVSQWESAKDQKCSMDPIYLLALKVHMSAYVGRETMRTDELRNMAQGNVSEPGEVRLGT